MLYALQYLKQLVASGGSLANFSFDSGSGDSGSIGVVMMMLVMVMTASLRDPKLELFLLDS